jgi:hypothetical protein
VKPLKRRRRRGAAPPSPRSLIALVIAVAVVIAAVVLIVRGDRTPRPSHGAAHHRGAQPRLAEAPASGRLYRAARVLTMSVLARDLVH